MSIPFPVLQPEEAAAMICHHDTIGFSGFTPAGACKAIPRAIAKMAKEEHAAGRPFSLGIVTGASTGKSLDGELAKAEAIKWRTPYQSDKDLRELVNRGRASFFDMHLSHVAQNLRYGFMGKIDWAIIEACDVTAEGEIVLTTSVGISPTVCQLADKIILEINEWHPKELRGFHDIYQPADPPHRREIPIYSATDRIGSPVIKVDPRKIVGVVYTKEADESRPFTDPDEKTIRIGQNVADFLASQIRKGTIPKNFLPIQSGVGNVANAVLIGMANHPDIPPFEMYSEVIQDSVIDLILEDKIKFVSGTSLSLTPEKIELLYSHIEEFRSRIILRPQEITNSPEVARRLGIISLNTPIEVDIFGNINSTHVLGKDMMNGIGGSGDFTRNAYISVFCCPSTAKGGRISAIVPQCSHVDHTEHDVQAIVTELGYADLRCKNPTERAEEIIGHCAHPDYQDDLLAYLHSSLSGHTPQTLGLAFAMHQKFLETGSMKDVDWGVLTRVASLLRTTRTASADRLPKPAPAASSASE